jgi:large subunit ribosomal protein L5
MQFRLKDKYNSEIKSALADEFEIKNVMEIPSLEKIVISVGAGDEAKDSKILQNIVDTISLIAGQKALVTKARKSIAGFKLRENFPIGVKVTLRGEKMYTFLDKLISVTLPRVRDFRGVPVNNFDGHGNYTFGLDEQLVFPEVKFDDILKTHGMNISFVTTCDDDRQAFQLLKLFGIPFAKGRN